MKSTCQKKFYREIAPLVKSIFKNLVGSLRGWKSTSICIIWMHPPINSIKSEGHWVTSQMAVYLEAVIGAMRSKDAGVLRWLEKAGSGMHSSPLRCPSLSSRGSLLCSLWHCLPPCSVFTAVVDSEGVQIWVRSSPNPDVVSLLASSPRASFIQFLLNHS